MNFCKTTFAVFFILGAAPSLDAHCDTLNGPVIADARLALDQGTVSPVLKWVPPESEPEIREAFQLALPARAKGAEAKEVADRYFFETVVRVHRQGEGVAFTGLKPAGTPVDPGIVAADRALEKNSLKDAELLLNDAMREGLHARFARLREARKHMNETAAAGREYVAAYVSFIHYVEKLHQDAAGNPGLEDHH